MRDDVWSLPWWSCEASTTTWNMCVVSSVTLNYFWASTTLQFPINFSLAKRRRIMGANILKLSVASRVHSPSLLSIKNCWVSQPTYHSIMTFHVPICSTNHSLNDPISLTPVRTSLSMFNQTFRKAAFCIFLICILSFFVCNTLFFYFFSIFAYLLVFDNFFLFVIHTMHP